MAQQRQSVTQSSRKSTQQRVFMSVKLDFLTTLATTAGEEIRRQRSQLDIRFKGGDELVTQADVAADQIIRDSIQSNYPDHQILSEELAPDADTNHEHLWIIDPIDGTVNYAHHHPQVAISIAYYHKGSAQLAVVHNPFLEETFSAEKGAGAYGPQKSKLFGSGA